MNNKNLHISRHITAVLLIIFLAAGAVHAESPDYGDSCSQAYPLTTLPANKYAYLGTSDEDFFKIVVGSPGLLTAASIYYSGVDPAGALYDANCNLIEENEDISWPSEPNFEISRPVEAGTYYVSVRAESATTQGYYWLVVDFEGEQEHTITASAGTGGSISPSGAVSVVNGGSQTFTISADPCYVISYITVDGVYKGAQNDWSFTNVTADHTITAYFNAAPALEISASAETGGTISPSGSVSVACGADQTFSIAANTGYEILDVVVDGVSRGAISSYTFNNVGDSHTIVARFQASGQYTITTIPGENGSMSPVGPIAVNAGDSQTITIIPDTGYSVQEVWVDGLSKGAVSSYTFSNVQADHTIEAHFTQGTGGTGSGCLTISDTPLDAIIRTAPPVVMFIIDDSGSMDWEIMTDEPSSKFGDPPASYVFDDPGDHFYGATSYHGKILTDDRRKDWKAQWSGYNTVYYNPQVRYDPWPNMSPADTATPRSHPRIDGVTLALAGTYLDLSDGDAVIVDNQDSGFATTWGTWSALTYYASAYNSYYIYTTLSEQTKKATWSPNLSNGYYKVYVRWPDSGNNADRVEYGIRDNGQAFDTVYKDQTSNFNVWNYLYTKYFDSDSYLELELDDDDAETMQAVADAVKFVPDDSVTINNAHYYTWHDGNENGELDSGESVYLVNFVDNSGDGRPDAREWYIVNDDGDDHIQKNELSAISESSVPGAVRPRSISDDLQNFANWYSYYRRREFASKAAVASVINQADGMLIGLSSINGVLKEPARKVGVDGVDERNLLLEALYDVGLSTSGTPLRSGLLNVGKYIDKTDGTDDGGIGASPYYSAENGGACQQVFAVLMTDGYYNGTAPTLGNVDGDNDSPYADSFSNTLADVAMYYYERDLVDDTDLEDMVPTSIRDSASHQHMVTYGVGFGVSGTLNPDDYDFETTFPTWPDPNPSVADENADKKKIDDLYHAAVNGRGLFLSASDAQELLNNLMMVLKDIEIYAGSASAVSVNGDELYTRINNDVRLFQSKYYSEHWHGDVLSYQLNQVTGAVVTPAVWSAAEQLSLKSADDRLIITSDGKSKGLPFRFKRIKKAMQNMLDSDDELAEKMLDYLRGDATDEASNGGTFRNRTWRINDPNHPLSGKTIISSKLGDVVHSSPVYKNGALYSGGNDGMLHCYNAETGEEIFAYVPYLVFNNLKYLTHQDYDHRYFVDLTPTVADVDVEGTTAMLVGGLGKGGKGYFALDISKAEIDPTRNIVPHNENQMRHMAMWEYPDNQTPQAERDDMGYSFSRVTIGKSHDTADAPWIVIFGNGYLSDNGSAVLLIIDPKSGHLLKKIDTGATGCNGLSTPMAVDVDYDNIIDYVYAGDLLGNLWKFDLTSNDYNNWDVAFYENNVPKPLFSTPGQPITTRPDATYHCGQDGYLVFFGTGKYLEESDLTDTTQQSIYGIWDYGDDVDDVEYAGEWDNSTSTLTSPYLLSGIGLHAQTATEYVDGGVLYRVTSEATPDWTVTNLNPSGSDCGDYSGDNSCDLNGTGEQADPLNTVGWMMNLPGNGERIVSDVLVRDNKLLVISYIPEGSLCGTGGSSWLMQLKACTGARLDSVFYDRDDDGDIDVDDQVEINPITGEKAVPSAILFDGRLQPPAIILMGSDKEMLYMSSSKGVIETQRQKSARMGIVYWRIFRP